MNPVFLEIGPIKLRYYGLMYAIAFLLVSVLEKKLQRKEILMLI